MSRAYDHALFVALASATMLVVSLLAQSWVVLAIAAVQLIAALILLDVLCIGTEADPINSLPRDQK